MSDFGAEHWAFLAMVVMILLGHLRFARLVKVTFVLALIVMAVSLWGSSEKGWGALSFVGLAVAAYVLYSTGVSIQAATEREEVAEKEARERLDELIQKRRIVAREQELVDAELEASHRLYQMSRDFGGVITMMEFHRELARLVLELVRARKALLVYLDTERGAPHTYKAYNLMDINADIENEITEDHPIWEHFRDPTSAGILSRMDTQRGEEVVIFLSYRGRIIGGVYLLEVNPPKTLAMDVRSLIYTLAVQVNMAANKCMLYLEIEKISRNDTLTEVYKRWYFLELLEEEFLRSKSENRPLTLLMIDLDHFKDFNDTYGHLAGDKVLSAVASYLKEHVRMQDILCRYGGEEFVVALPDTPSDSALVAAERLRAAIAERPIQVGRMVTTVTISIGGTTFPQDEDNLNALLERADAEMYRSKEAGRNKISFPGKEPVGPGLRSNNE